MGLTHFYIILFIFIGGKLTKYYVTVLWGESPDPDRKPVTYTFNTQEESNAFELGMGEMDGWLGYRYVRHRKPREFTQEEIETLQYDEPIFKGG